jgi:AraC-like DNA-binding protein
MSSGAIVVHRVKCDSRQFAPDIGRRLLYQELVFRKPHMFSAVTLTLTPVRLQGRQRWHNETADLAFVFPDAGAGQCLCRNGAQRMESGDILLLNSKSGSELECEPKGRFCFSFFSANSEHLLPVFRWNEMAQVERITRQIEGVRVYPASWQLAANCHRLLKNLGPEPDLEHRAQLLRIACTVLAFELKHSQPERSDYLHLQGRMSEVFDTRSAGDILNLPVTELAARFNCTRRHLTRLFNQHFGCSIAALRMELRMLRTASLLADPHLSVRQVADQCGFSHSGLFSQCFQRRFGATATEWRSGAAKTGSVPDQEITTNLNCGLQTEGLCPWLPQAVPAPDQPEGTARKLENL